jgi:hypothetical protein
MYHSPMPEQSAKSHASTDPMFLAIVIVLFANVIFACVHAFHYRDAYFCFQILVAIALLLGALKMRAYGTKNQDRVIRLEEQVRFTRLLPEPLLARSAALSVDQYIGLRFACDAELPALVERTLAENLTRKQIKEAIATWRADHFRL